MSTAGFYRFQDGELTYAQESVHAPNNVVLLISEKNNYSYPIEGWRYFDSLNEAENYFVINGAISGNFDEFTDALRTENGFAATFEAVLQTDPMLASSMAAYLETFRTQGEWRQYLWSLQEAIKLIPNQQQQAYIANEFLQLAQRCNFPSGFIEAFEAIIPTPPGG
jgi:hypothetical protein